MKLVQAFEQKTDEERKKTIDDAIANRDHHEKNMKRLPMQIMMNRKIFKKLTFLPGILKVIGRAGNVGYTLVWCDIIKEVDTLASHGIDLISMMHKKIGNGLNISFWEDWWRGEQRLKEVFPCIYALEVNKHISVAFKFEQTSLSSSLRRMPRSGIESKQWDHLLDNLEGVMLNPSEDRWSWVY
nr:hypothetical protein [Tanacetum cinerariifolium]